MCYSISWDGNSNTVTLHGHEATVETTTVPVPGAEAAATIYTKPPTLYVLFSDGGRQFMAPETFEAKLEHAGRAPLTLTILHGRQGAEITKATWSAAGITNRDIRAYGRVEDLIRPLLVRSFVRIEMDPLPVAPPDGEFPDPATIPRVRRLEHDFDVDPPEAYLSALFTAWRRVHGRGRHGPTPEQLQSVVELRAQGLTFKEIGRQMDDRDQATMHRWYQRAVDERTNDNRGTSE